MRRAAFTLVEMLVAVALLGMIASLLFFSLDQVSRATASGLGKATMYQDLRTVADQMSRELQQAIPYVVVNGSVTNSVFLGGTNEVHFVATIDNNTGNEEVEVHYFYDGTNALWKAFAYGSTNTSGIWDFQNTARFNTSLSAVNVNSWALTPDTDSYSPVLYGVKACTFRFSNDPAALTNFSLAATWFGHRQSIPGYAQVTIVAFDAAVIRRWGSADKVPTALTNLARTTTFFVQLPRQDD